MAVAKLHTIQIYSHYRESARRYSDRLSRYSHSIFMIDISCYYSLLKSSVTDNVADGLLHDAMNVQKDTSEFSCSVLDSNGGPLDRS